MPTTFSLKPSPSLVVERGLRRLAERALSALADARRRRDARATVDALSVLDSAALRDLGVDRSELASAAAELHGSALPQRARVLHSLFATEVQR